MISNSRKMAPLHPSRFTNPATGEPYKSASIDGTFIWYSQGVQKLAMDEIGKEGYNQLEWEWTDLLRPVRGSVKHA